MAGTRDASSPSSRSLHVVVFPWLAFGRMILFLELSKRLARRGHAVTFVSTPRNAARLGAIPPDLFPRVRVVTLELPAVEGLPAGAKSTADVPPEKVELLKVAFDGLAAPFAAPCRWPHGWRRRGRRIACAMFLILPAALLAYVGTKQSNEVHSRRTTEDYMAQPPWVPFPSTLFYRRHEAEAIAAAFRPNASGVSDMDRLMQLHRPSCRLVPVVPAGLLLPGDAEDDDAQPGGGDQPFVAAARWLDEQPRRSVIYVALGSEAPVTVGHIRELAIGLELSGARFLLALRAPGGRTPAALLPDGFEQRVAGRGVVLAGWVAQVRVLAHAAVGAFLTHCGWGSTVEGLFRFGHPLVMLPFVADQGLVARAMAARGVGVEVPRDEDGGGSFRGADVAAAVKRVMAGEEGEEMARKARELREVVGDRVRQERYVDELVQLLRRYK
ncbi:hypothetical protein GQ55_2G092300 [Panicum hallii var. hallii]|uniref:Glycosyltransferase n=1 Tax=Panicum hallii var. hallii TaxID=1504633 RepID=A0A2T7EN44_9POAL|nr:hypothetical protein GQ55_2G092300 [Panicum hallii var. hallii]